VRGMRACTGANPARRESGKGRPGRPAARQQGDGRQDRASPSLIRRCPGSLSLPGKGSTNSPHDAGLPRWPHLPAAAACACSVPRASAIARAGLSARSGRAITSRVAAWITLDSPRSAGEP